MSRKVARLLGFEPKTFCLEGRCSIQLSYRRSLMNHNGPRPWVQAWGDGNLPVHATGLRIRMNSQAPGRTPR